MVKGLGFPSHRSPMVKGLATGAATWCFNTYAPLRYISPFGYIHSIYTPEIVNMTPVKYHGGRNYKTNTTIQVHDPRYTQHIFYTLCRGISGISRGIHSASFTAGAVLVPSSGLGLARRSALRATNSRPHRQKQPNNQPIKYNP